MQTKTVKTYLAPVREMPGSPPTVRIWEAHWRKRGWSTKVLTPGVAMQHPRYREFSARVNSFPSVNPKEYEVACWMRWLALAQDGGGLMVDFDVLNRNYPQASLPPGADIAVLARRSIPCAVLATKIGAEKIVHDILTHKPTFTDHYSDMYFFMQSGKYPTSELCVEAGDVDWQEAPLVHYSGNACRVGGRNRHEWMRELA